MDEAFKAKNEVLQQAASQKLIPWCSIFLVAMIVLAHTIVLMGNMSTASAFGSIGDSTDGWSGVGLHLAESLEGELEAVLKEVTTELTDAINKIMQVTNMLDMVVGFQSKSIDAVVTSNATKALVLLQAHGIMDTSQWTNGVSSMIAKSMTTSLEQLTGAITEAIKKLLDKLKPALVQVGKFILKFGPKVQDIIETFSVTLDRVQKIFDQVMAQLASGGAEQDKMEHETFHLFDTTDTGTIEVVDLQNVAKIYNIPALQGNKSDHLVKKYDDDNSGHLDKDEFMLMVHDKSVPNLMSVVLRSFAKSLAQVAGQVGGSRFRGEIADDVADYLELMTAKNHTKVDWISDALGNSSLPLDFTADVLIAIALKVDDPNTHKSIPTGSYVVSQLMKLHPKQAAKAIDKVSDAKFFTSQGYSPDDHAEVVKRITKWSTQKHSSSSLAQVYDMDEASDKVTVGADGSIDGDFGATMLLERKLVETMEELAYKVTDENMQSHLDEIEDERRSHSDAILGSDTAQYLLLQLTGGRRAGGKQTKPNDPAAAATKSQIPAAAETLKFAKYLAFNASNTAHRFQHMAFNYQKTSSNAIDSFATQIQAMVKKIQGFIKTMMQYSTPDGIDALETTLLNYAEQQIKDMLVATEKGVDRLIAKDTASSKGGSLSDMAMGKKIEHALASPLGQGLAPSVAQELEKSLNDQTSDLSSGQLSKEIVKLLETMANTSLSTVSKSLDDTVGDGKISFLHIDPDGDSFKSLHAAGLGTVDKTLMADLDKDVQKALRHAQHPGAELVQMSSDDDNQVSALMDDAVQILHSLEHILPQATKALIFAKKEVSMLSKTLNNIFKVFKKEGPDTFNGIDGMYGNVWMLYYFLMLTLPLSMLWYAFWAGGFCGGPGSKIPQEGEDKERTSAYQKCCGCLEDCCRVLCCCHEWIEYGGAEMCFWSVIILLQVVVLVLFLLAIVITLIAAIQFFLASGCSQIYLLGDMSICGGVLQALRDFLETFIPGVSSDDFPQHCVDTQLLTCDLIGSKMTSAATYTVVGSFLAAAMTFQMIIESGQLHSRALARMKFEQIWDKRHEGAAPSPSKAKQ